MKYITVVLISTLLAACAKPGTSGTASAMSTKPVFSTWYLADGSALDLRGLTFGTTSAVLPVKLYGTTYHCQTMVQATGSEAQGQVVVQSAVAIGLPAGSYTTACQDLVATYDFIRNQDGMQIGRLGSAPLQYY